MATIKVKFRQFAESEQGGSVYYRIYHRNQIRQIASGYTMQGGRVAVKKWLQIRKISTQQTGDGNHFPQNRV